MHSSVVLHKESPCFFVSFKHYCLALHPNCEYDSVAGREHSSVPLFLSGIFVNWCGGQVQLNPLLAKPYRFFMKQQSFYITLLSRWLSIW